MKQSILTAFQAISKTSPNAVISPFGLEIIFTLLAEGTTGETRQELCRLLEVDSDSSFWEDLCQKLATLGHLDQGSIFTQNNSIHYSPRVDVKDSYLKQIQAFVPLKLQQMIFIDPNVGFAADNDLHLKAKWKQRFNEISGKTEFFTLKTGEQLESAFIHQTNIHGENENRYLRSTHFQAIQIPLNDVRLRLEIYLPHEIDGLESFIQQLHHQQLLEWGDDFVPVRSMEVMLPEFEIENHFYSWYIENLWKLVENIRDAEHEALLDELLDINL